MPNFTPESFNKNDNKPYLIYKENDVWILDYCIKENRREKSEFTNLFNLCFLLLNHFNNPNLISFASSTLISIPRGTKVIVLKVGSVGLADNVDEYITIGTIISSEYNAALCAKEYIIYTDEGEQVKAIRKKIGESLYTFSPIKQFCTIENFLNETNQRFASNSVNYNKYNSYILKDDLLPFLFKNV